MIIHSDIEQGSEAWLMLRLGKMTASKFADLMTEPRSKSELLSKTTESYLMQLACEKVMGKPLPSFKSDAMQRGNDAEPVARNFYELKNSVEVEQVSFIELSDYCGVSPDGLVGADGMLEIKCPETLTQVKRYLGGVGLPPEYTWQVQGQLWVAEREWCDFVSFDDRIDTNAQYIQTRVYRDDEAIKKLAAKVQMCEAILRDYIEKLSKPFEF